MKEEEENRKLQENAGTSSPAALSVTVSVCS